MTVSREDIDRYLNKEFSELMPEAHVPGFRPGHAPRKLVENRFRKDVVGRVKGALLMDSLAQIHDDYDLSAIGEPELDLETVEVPEQGPMTFEFDLEVRPQFDLPQWKGLQIEKPVREFTDADIDRALKRILTNRGRLVPFDGPAEPDDYITTNLTFKHGEQVLSSAAEEVIRLRPVLSFRDGKIEGFDKAMAGVRGGETRELTMQLSERRPQRGPSRAAGHGRLRSARSQEAAIAGIDPGIAAGTGRFRARGRSPRRDQGHARPAAWSISSGSGPASRSRPP